MQQIIGSLESGAVEVVDVPRPRPGRGELLVASEFSVISAGTERMLVSFGAASLVKKAAREPGRVRQVIDKATTDGIRPTVDAVRAKLEAPIALGYSSSGVVVEVGEGIVGFEPGDRVATNGPHAEMTVVPARLSARVPDGVSMRHAAFATVTAVAINALRDGELELGSIVAIVGLGLIGQLTARVASSAGYRVVAFEPDGQRAESITAFGTAFADAHSFVEHLQARTRGAGADAVIITADVGSRGDGPDPIDLAARAARRRGNVVLVGNGDPKLDRSVFYEKELGFRVARSYGPGRSDRLWEAGIVEYDRDVERWTAQRNFEVALELMAEGRLSLDGLDIDEFALEAAPTVYAQLAERGGSVASLFRYPAQIDGADIVPVTARKRSAGDIAVGVVGAGNYVTRVLAPALVDSGSELRIVASRGGLSSVLAGRKFGFRSSTTNIDRMLDDPEIDAVFIATRHDSHAELAVAALESGKHVWLEKPAAIRRDALDALEAAWREHRNESMLMVGYNRRFAPTLRELRDAIHGQGTASMIYTVNAGRIAPDHWLADRRVGGGRLIGEASHFVDALRFLAGSPIRRSHAALRGRDEGTIVLEFENGSTGTLHYLTNGHPSIPKERLEVFAGGRIYQLANFRGLDIYEDKFAPFEKLRKLGRTPTQDKGHAAAVFAFLDAIRRGDVSPVPFDESLEVARVLFDVLGE